MGGKRNVLLRQDLTRGKGGVRWVGLRVHVKKWLCWGVWIGSSLICYSIQTYVVPVTIFIVPFSPSPKVFLLYTQLLIVPWQDIRTRDLSLSLTLLVGLLLGS